MKCLSVRQPWTWAIFHGGKTVENRTWKTNYRGPMLIHAALSRTELSADRDWIATRTGLDVPGDGLTFGAIVGVVDVVGCIPGLLVELFSKRPNVWATGPWCWVLDNPRPLLSPIPYRGSLGLFDVPGDVVRRIELSDGTGLDVRAEQLLLW